MRKWCNFADGQLKVSPFSISPSCIRRSHKLLTPSESSRYAGIGLRGNIELNEIRRKQSRVGMLMELISVRCVNNVSISRVCFCFRLRYNSYKQSFLHQLVFLSLKGNKTKSWLVTHQKLLCLLTKLFHWHCRFLPLNKRLFILL